jgi:hypothetical protein
MNTRWGKTVTDFSDLSVTAAEGFDWICVSQKEITGLDESFFKSVAAAQMQHSLPFACCFLDFPGKVRVTGRGFNEYIWLDYYKKAIIRLSKLGCRALNWNDGSARMLPEEGEVSWAKEQVMQFLFLLSGIAEKYDIQVLIEPLRENRTNFLTTIEETVQFIRSIGTDNIGLSLTDSQTEEEPQLASVLQRCRDEIRLVSITRNSCKTGEHAQVSNFISALRSITYTGPVLLPPDTDAEGLLRCKQLFA